MHTALVLADWPVHMLPNAGLDSEWLRLLERARGVRQSFPGIGELHPGAWTVPLRDQTRGGPRALAALCRALDGDQGQEGWGYRVLVLEREPDWLTAPSQRG